MSQFGIIIDMISAALKQASPQRVVTRDLKDFSDHDAQDIQKGVFTLINQNVHADENDIEYLDLLLVGQIELAEGALPSAIEEAELTMIDEVRHFCQGLYGTQIVRGKFRQSAQLDAPYGFISGTLRVGPFNFDMPLDASLAPFIFFHADSQQIITEEVLPQ